MNEKELDKGFYVETGWARLAGPYNLYSPTELRHFNRACEQLRLDKSIVWETRGENDAKDIYRTNMIICKRLKYD